MMTRLAQVVALLLAAGTVCSCSTPGDPFGEDDCDMAILVSNATDRIVMFDLWPPGWPNGFACGANRITPIPAAWTNMATDMLWVSPGAAFAVNFESQAYTNGMRIPIRRVITQEEADRHPLGEQAAGIARRCYTNGEPLVYLDFTHCETIPGEVFAPSRTNDFPLFVIDHFQDGEEAANQTGGR